LIRSLLEGSRMKWLRGEPHGDVLNLGLELHLWQSLDN
jgi:hypothetical protein